MMLPNTFSRGCPCFSYMANRKNGSIASTMIKVAALWGTLPLMRKNRGTPTTAAMLKHTSCRLVRFNATLVFTLVRSFGTVTYAIFEPPFCPLGAVSLMCVENAFCKASRLKEGEAEYHGVGGYAENGTVQV